jgi:predicted RNA-binding protein with PUA-like domain
MAANYWIVKQEPSAYSWSDFVADGSTPWTGVRNFQARNNLKAMRKGDRALFYHSVVGRAVVGIAQVAKEAYPDPTDLKWICVDLIPIEPLKTPVTLEQIKAHPTLANIGLVKQSRLSVIALKPEEYRTILQISQAEM